MNFYTEVPAKCTLSGEHSILRGGCAIVVPFDYYKLTLKYTLNEIKTMHTISAELGTSLPVFLWPVVSNALNLLGKNPSKLTGLFKITSTIPPCAGLGFSAALCVAVTRWVIHCGFLTESDLINFSIQLEDMFHGKSSGVDIAGVLANKPIQYFNNKEYIEIESKWNPNLYISSSDEHSFTESCIKTIDALRNNDPKRAKLIDDKMNTAALIIKLALETKTADRLSLLSYALNMGNECFYEWGLVSKKLDQHIMELKKYALACKVIGAGFGGYVVSLWENNPSNKLNMKFRKLNMYHE
jgi:mevalonate kinase